MTASKTTIGENETYYMEVSIIDNTDGTLVSGNTVTYTILDTSDESTVASGTLTEVGSSGLYKGSQGFSDIGNYRIVYSTSGYADVSESVFVTDVNTDVNDLVKIGVNRWKLDSTANTFTIYDDDQTTPLFVFDMKDASGTASVNRIFERDPQ